MSAAQDPILLSVAEMYRADALAIDGGVAGITLMEAAGKACADAICGHWDLTATLILCGPGNNGGDGFVIARLLAERGWPVTLALLGDVDKLTGDAAVAAAGWRGEIVAMTPDRVQPGMLVVDAVFGAGLQRPVTGVSAAMFAAIAAHGNPVMAVDVPSGVHGDSGAVLGTAPQAELTVTFFRRKPGHLLYPGRRHCGKVICADIGTPLQVLEDIAPQTTINRPGLWRPEFPRRAPEDHKYTHGHAVVAGGGLACTGATRLAAYAALRMGSGLVTVAAPADAFQVYAASLTAVMCRKISTLDRFSELISDRRLNAFLLGPGMGVNESGRQKVLAALATGRAVLLDADALTAFADDPEILFAAIAGDTVLTPTVLTPHEGEFARLFPDLDMQTQDKLSRARAAAARSGAVIVLKGADTVIAAPDGRAAISDNAPAWLATAGSGDVLAGFITGLMAQGMSAFMAACAGVWCHGAAAQHVGRGLIAEDLAPAMPFVFAQLAREWQ